MIKQVYKFNPIFKFLLFLLIFINLIFLTSASQISLEHKFNIDYWEENQINKGQINIKVTNLGNARATDVYIIINISNELIKSKTISELRPNQHVDFTFPIGNFEFDDQKLFLIKTYYSDRNGYSFSSPNVILFSKGEIISFYEPITPSKINIYNNHNFNFKLNSDSYKFLIFGPDELNINKKLIKSQKQGDFNLRIGKGSSLVGSIYPLYIISFNDKMSISLIHVEIKERSKINFIIIIFVSLLILIIFLFFIFYYFKKFDIYFFKNIFNQKRFNQNILSKDLLDKFVYKNIFDFIVLLMIFIFLLLYFKPDLILSSTITAGGDTASHYLTIEHYIKEFFFNFKTSGWDMGNYAGFPLLQFYFPLPFFLMAVLSFFVSIPVAFKLITILGIFLLPFSLYIMAKLMKFKFPIPILAAISSLAFLFMEANSMWGGNIPSTLAGEFSYSIAFALSFIFLGTLFYGIKENKYLVFNSILIFIIGVTHLYGLLFCTFCSIFFIKKKKNLDYLLKLGVSSFLLLGFWMVPMFMNLSYTTAYGDKWLISFSEVFPIIILPFIYIILLNLLFFKKFLKDDRNQFIIFSLFTTFLLYISAYYVGLVDIRFIPFIQLLLILLGIFSFSNLFEKINKNEFFKNKFKLISIIFVVIFFIFTVYHVEKNVNYIDHWINWNYEGFENKNSWNNFQEINTYLMNDKSNSRVVFEHSSFNNVFGTTRAFEMLPYFANRSTLEGLYMQSSISAPFVFYIQALISREKSCPFPNFGCSRTNFTRAEKRLQMFNVGSLIIRSDYSKNLINQNNFYNFSFKFDNYEIYKIEEKGYVFVPDYRPILVESENYQLTSYLWFINDSAIDVHLVFDKNILYEDNQIKNYFIKEELQTECNIYSNIEHEKIYFYTECLNKPHIISVSYYPKWKSLSGEKIYYVSPSFMLIYPTQNEIVLKYTRNKYDYIGLFFSLFGLLFIYYLNYYNKFNFVKNKKQYFTIVILLVLLFLFLASYIYTSLSSDDELILEIAVSTGSYVACDNTHSLRENCLLLVALKNNDSNICTRSKNQDECFYNYAISKKDNLICDFITQNEVKIKCKILLS